MPKPGRTPTPTETKRRRGSARGRYGVDREPRPERGRPEPPKGTSKKGKLVWKNLVELLDAMGVMTTADTLVVQRYCETYIRWREAADFVIKRGTVYAVKKWDPNADKGKGDFVPVGFREFPQAQQEMRCCDRLIVMERELGLTPSARTRIYIEELGPRPVGRPPGTDEDLGKIKPAAHDVSKGPRLKVIKGA